MSADDARHAFLRIARSTEASGDEPETRPPFPVLSDPLVRQITECSPDVIMVVDPEGRIEFISRPAPGLTHEQVNGTLVYDYIPAEQHGAVRACFQRVLQTGTPDRYNVTHARPNGELTSWESRVGPVVEDGRIGRFVVSASNVTERRAAAAERDRLFELSVDILCTVTYEGVVLRANPAFEATLGYSPVDEGPLSLFDLAHPDDADELRRAVQQMTDDKLLSAVQGRWHSKGDGYRTLEWRFTSDPDRQRFHAVGRDVTVQRTLEQRLRQAEKLEAVGQLAGGLAHDFNNLSLAITLHASSAACLTDDAALAGHLGEISRAAERATALTRQLLAFSRRAPLERSVFDLGSLICDLMGLLRRLLPENIAIDVISSGTPTMVEADYGQIELVVVNLCLNARDAMPDGGRIRIETRSTRQPTPTNPDAPDQEMVLLAVSDTGTGMTATVCERIFEPFFTTKGSDHGSGLGLATAYATVARHGGMIQVDSEPGRGSRFEIRLPATGAARTRPASAGPKAPPGGSETIVVAEDDELVRSIVSEVLESAGYNVLVASDGAQAMRLVDEHASEVRLVLLDVVMPAIDGPEACRLIRERHPHLPVVLSSGYGGMSELTLDPGVELLRKPYKPATLLHKVRRILERG